MFCKHDWKILSEVTTKSEVEILSGLGITSAKGYGAERKYIQIVTCEKCGKLKRFVENI